MAKWTVHLTCNGSVVSSHCFFELETLSFFLSTGWLQEQI